MATGTNNAPTGGVTISGTATQGQTLTATNTLADLDGLGTITYQWSAAGLAITGATASTYTLTQGEVGKAITVTASYTDGKGTDELIAGGTNGAVSNVNDAPTGAVTIGGTVTRSQTLTATNTLADLDGLGFHRYRSHGGEQVRAQQWAVGHPATREAEPFAVLGEIKGRDVADADTEFHNRNLLI